MNRLARLSLALGCVLSTAPWLPSLAAGGTTVTQRTNAKGEVTSTTVTHGSTYDPEPGLAALLKGQAELRKAMADLVSAHARVVQAQGQANLSNAQARQSLENARTEALAGRVKAVKGFYEKRKLYETHQEITAGPMKPNAPPAPAGASASSAVDPASGTVHWPSALLHSDLLAERIEVEELLAERRRNGTRVSAEVRNAAERMKRHLRARIREIPPTQYSGAKRFLDALALEAQRTPALGPVAGR